MNLTLSSLSLSHLSHSPFHAHSLLSQKSSLNIKKSKFSKSTNSFFYTAGNLISLSVVKTEFNRFINTVVHFDRTIEKVSEYFYNETFDFSNENEDVFFSECKFTKCYNKNAAAMCIYNADRYTNSYKLTVERCAFVMIVSGSSAGAIHFTGSDITLKECCFNMCVTELRFQTYYLNAKGQLHVTGVAKDQCSPVIAVGLSFVEHVRGNNLTVKDCNNTRCKVRERRCCSSFGANKIMRYKYSMHINNTGQSYFGFNLDTTSEYEISDAILYRCHPSSQEIGLIETGRPIVIKRFSFIQTKMLWLIASDSDSMDGFQTTADGECLFVDCITDVASRKYTINGKNITFQNLTKISRGLTFDVSYIYGDWACQTDIPRTPLPSVSPTPEQTPSPSPMPTMTIPPVNYMMNPNEVELVDIERGDKQSKLTTGDIIQLVILGLLSAVTVYVFVLVSKKKKANLVTAEEREALLQY